MNRKRERESKTGTVIERQRYRDTHREKDNIRDKEIKRK
jgi:hypothetical protein